MLPVLRNTEFLELKKIPVMAEQNWKDVCANCEKPYTGNYLKKMVIFRGFYHSGVLFVPGRHLG
jgi:hypothetical protein